MQRIATGGPLNRLNEMFKCNHPKLTVPVMALLDHHRDLCAPDDVRVAIERHAGAPACPCGLRSAGTVEMFAGRLFAAQFQPGAQAWLSQHGRHTYQQCLDFHMALFCEAPLRGRRFEELSREEMVRGLRAADPNGAWTSRRATKVEDAAMAVDYILVAEDGTQVGVQVKPESVMSRPDVIAMNQQKHRAFPGAVIWHVYGQDGAFRDTEGMVSDAAQRRRGAKREGGAEGEIAGKAVPSPKRRKCDPV